MSPQKLGSILFFPGLKKGVLPFKPTRIPFLWECPLVFILILVFQHFSMAAVIVEPLPILHVNIIIHSRECNAKKCLR